MHTATVIKNAPRQYCEALDQANTVAWSTHSDAIHQALKNNILHSRLYVTFDDNRLIVGGSWHPPFEEQENKFHVAAGKFDGDERNCKYANSTATLEEAIKLLDFVSDYPWVQLTTQINGKWYDITPREIEQ